MPSTIGVSASTWTPAKLSPVVWLDAADTSTITASAGKVSQWRDRSANGYHVAQPTSARQPSTGVSSLNGRNVVSFNGSTSLWHSDRTPWKFLHDGTKHTMFVVAQITNSGSLYPAICGTCPTAGDGPGFDLLCVRSASSFRHVVTNNVDAGTVFNDKSNEITFASPFRVTISADPANASASARSTYKINNRASVAVSTATGTPSSAQAAYPLVVGGRTTGPTDITLLTGFIAEMIFVQSELNAGQIAVVESYLSSKWGL